MMVFGRSSSRNLHCRCLLRSGSPVDFYRVGAGYCYAFYGCPERGIDAGGRCFG